jgi:hypothetical protein
MKRLKSFLKILWAYIWPTAEIGKVNYMKTSEEYYGINRGPKDFSQSIAVDRYIMPCTVLSDSLPENKPVFVKGDLLECDHILTIYRPKYHKDILRNLNFLPANDGIVSEQSVILPMMDEVYENTMILGDIIKKINSPETREAIDNALMDLFDYGECRMPDINFSIKRRGAV